MATNGHLACPNCDFGAILAGVAGMAGHSRHYWQKCGQRPEWLIGGHSLSPLVDNGPELATGALQQHTRSIETFSIDAPDQEPNPFALSVWAHSCGRHSLLVLKRVLNREVTTKVTLSSSHSHELLSGSTITTPYLGADASIVAHQARWSAAHCRWTQCGQLSGYRCL